MNIQMVGEKRLLDEASVISQTDVSKCIRILEEGLLESPECRNISHTSPAISPKRQNVEDIRFNGVLFEASVSQNAFVRKGLTNESKARVWECFVKFPENYRNRWLTSTQVTDILKQNFHLINISSEVIFDVVKEKTRANSSYAACIMQFGKLGKEFYFVRSLCTVFQPVFQRVPTVGTCLDYNFDQGALIQTNSIVASYEKHLISRILFPYENLIRAQQSWVGWSRNHSLNDAPSPEAGNFVHFVTKDDSAESKVEESKIS